MLDTLDEQWVWDLVTRRGSTESFTKCVSNGRVLPSSCLPGRPVDADGRATGGREDWYDLTVSLLSHYESI